MSLESLDLREVESAIEGILFASGEPLAIGTNELGPGLMKFEKR